MGRTHHKEVLTTGQVAKICHVAPRTVSKWFDTGELRGYRIPGSRDRRIPRKQLEAFMASHGMPLEDLNDKGSQVLIVDRDVPSELLESLNGSGGLEILTADNGFEAGVLADQLQPAVVILATDRDPEGAAAICRNIKSTDTLRGVSVVAASTGLTPRAARRLKDKGFDQCLAKPYTAEKLLELVAEATGSSE